MSMFGRAELPLAVPACTADTSVDGRQSPSPLQPSPVTELAHGLISACISGATPPASAGVVSMDNTRNVASSSRRSSLLLLDAGVDENALDTPTTALILGGAQRCTVMRRSSVSSASISCDQHQQPTPTIVSRSLCSLSGCSSSSCGCCCSTSSRSQDEIGRRRRTGVLRATADSGESWRRSNTLPLRHRLLQASACNNSSEDKENSSIISSSKNNSGEDAQIRKKTAGEDAASVGAITPTSTMTRRQWRRRPLAAVQRSLSTSSSSSSSSASPACFVAAAATARRSTAGCGEFHFAAPTSRAPRGAHRSLWGSPQQNNTSSSCCLDASTSNVLPVGLCDLLSAPILHIPPVSSSEEDSETDGDRAGSSSDGTDCSCRTGRQHVTASRTGQLKRCEPPSHELPSSSTSKRACTEQTTGTTFEWQRSESYSVSSQCERVVPLQRCHSESEATIKRALQRSCQDPDLISDFTRVYALPLCAGVTSKNVDLRMLNADTLAALMDGHFSSSVASFRIIDCRYPYEFDGGHIRDAVNLYVKDDVHRVLLAERQQLPAPRLEDAPTHRRGDILIFHCEFSSERGPSMFRFVRAQDRQLNRHAYPALHYPEMYLLEGGYKKFFASHPRLCAPCSYRPMNKAGHEHELKHFRAKSKSWAGDCKARGVSKRIVL